MQPYPRAPYLVWPGHMHGTGCLIARAMDTGFPTVVLCLCFGPGCVWARASAAPRHSWLGCWGVCVFVCPLHFRPPTPGWGVRHGCVCLGSGFGCAPPLLAGVLGCVCVCVRALLVPRHSWLGRVVRVCFWARVSAAPRHSLLGCWGVCVFVYALHLYPATPGQGVWGVYVFVCPLPCNNKITGEQTVKMLVEQWFESYGAPKQVHSDEDVRIRSDTGWYKQVLNALNVEVTTYVPYTHTSNPPCERQNRDVEQNLRILMKQELTKDWVRLVPWAVLTMNSQRSSWTGFTPHELIHGGRPAWFFKTPFLRTSRARLEIGWNTGSLWLTRLGLTLDTFVTVN